MLATAIRTPRIVAASVAGPSHTARGVGCEDAFATQVLDDGTAVIAVADGLGSARRASVGAHAGVATAVRAARALLAAAPEFPLGAAALHLAACARHGILALGDPPEHACTLMVALARGSSVGVAHIGDGAVCVEHDGWEVLSASDQEYADVTDPITSPAWRASVRVAVAEGVTRVAVFTDGLARAAISPDGSAFGGFLDPVADATSEEVEELLAGERLSEHSDDDKTIVVVTLC